MADDPNVNDNQNDDPGDGQGGEGGGEQKPQFADKYETREALNDGIGEIAEKLEMDIDAASMDDKSAETMYRAINRMWTKRNQSADDDPGDGDADDNDDSGEGDGGDVDLNLDQPEITDDDTVATVLEKTGLKAEAITEQWQSEGALTDEQYDRIKEAIPGATRGMIDDFMTSQQALASTAQEQQNVIRSKATEMVGGDTQLKNLLDYGRSLPKAVREDINERLKDPNRYEGALIELQSRHSRDVKSDKAKPLVDGSGGSNSSQGLITDPAEYKKTLRSATQGDTQAQKRLAAHAKAKNQRR